MKLFEPNEKRTTVAIYVFLVALFGVFCVIVGVNIGFIAKVFAFVLDVIKPILYGFAFAFVLHPLISVTENTVFAGWKKTNPGVKHTLSIVVVYVSVVLLVVLFCVSVIPEFIGNYDTFATQLAAFADNFQNKVAEIINRFPGGESIYVYYDVAPDLRADPSNDLFVFSLGEANGIPLGAKPNTVLEQVREFFSGLIDAVTGRFSLSGIFSSALAALNSAKNIIIGIIISIYFLASEKKILNHLNRTARAWLPHSAYRHFMWVLEKISDIFRGYIMVRIADGFIIGFFTFFLLLIFRVPYRLLLSVVMGVASFFPFIGPLIGIVFGSLIVTIVDIHYLPVYLITTTILNILDSRYIEPLLNKDGNCTTLSAIWVFAAIVVMGGFFGVTGVVIGIPFVAFIYSLVKEISEKRLKRLHLPVETSAYFVAHAAPPPEVISESEESDIPPDMETYFAEKRDDELETARNIQANVSGKYAAAKKFFGKLGTFFKRVFKKIGNFFKNIFKPKKRK